jgi:hypothetical protein
MEWTRAGCRPIVLRKVRPEVSKTSIAIVMVENRQRLLGDVPIEIR